MNAKHMLGMRIFTITLLIVPSLAFQPAASRPVQASPAAQSESQTGQEVLRELNRTVGEPEIIDAQPKSGEYIQETGKLTPSLNSPALPPDPPKESPDRPPPPRASYWTVLKSETFEGVFPNSLWNAFDNNGATYGEYYWDDDDFKPHLGSWSAWPANGGANGVDPQSNNYANNMDSWMLYGPFDLSNCAAADFEFYYWNKSEPNFDFFGWGASPNGSNVYGWQLSGDQSSWNYVDFNLEPYLGDSSVWLAFIFRSDGSVTDIGPFVDDITLWCYTQTTLSSWTYMVYLAGDNNLEDAAIGDFMEMSAVGSDANVKIVAQLDRISGYNAAYGDWTDTRRFDITAGLTPEAANGVSIGEANMGQAETLLNFIRWAKARAPASHYVLVLWDHGSGWKEDEEHLFKGVSFDDTSSGDNIDMPELRSVLSAVTNAGTNKIDIVGMDACLMAMIEVDNQIRQYASIRVGSEESEPNDGWPHDTILAALKATPAMSANTLATNIVDYYYSSYGNNYTHSAVNLGSTYATLNTAVNTLATALNNNGANYIAEIQTARNAATQFSDSTFIDLWDFADLIRVYVPEPTINAAAVSVKNAVTATVIHEHHGGTWPWARGISIYFPKTSGAYDARYDGSTGFLQFTGSTQWDEWVRKYHAFASYPAMFNKSTPANGATSQPLSLTFNWAASAGATAYDICMFDTTNDNTCNGGGNWFDLGNSTSVAVGGLTESTAYYWQVRARNASGAVYANKGTWWSITTGSLPAAFNKSGPANGATSQPLNPTLTWGASTGATSYEYCYDTTNDNACSGWTSNGASTSKALSGLNPYTTYYWHVRALNSTGVRFSNGSSTAYWSFTTGGVPGAFNKSSPADGATNQPLSLTLQWGASSNAASYEYCYDTTDDDACSGWTSNGTSTSKALSGLDSHTTYYWHVRALNTFGTTYANGSSTAFWSFTTGGIPSSFDKISPADDATNQPLSLTLNWDASSGVSSYEFCYDTSNDNACSGWTSNGTSTSKDLSGLSQYTTYYWHVRALNAFGTRYSNSSNTAYWSFTTGGLPAAFSKTSPADGASNRPSNPVLQWAASSNADSYEYCYDTSDDDACSGWTDNGTATSAPLSGLSPGETYYWQVRALNSFGARFANGSSTAYWSFTTGNIPGAFNKSSPSNGAAGLPTELTLQWSSSSSVTDYEYCYDTSDDDACSTWENNGNLTTANLSGLTPLTTYYWHVRSVNSFGTTYANGSGTAFWSFTTGDVPGAFNKLSPADGATGLPASLTLQWSASDGATSYAYCYDASDDDACSGWVNVGNSTSAPLSGLVPGMTYYWQVRAVNSEGTTYADGSSSAYWSCSIKSSPQKKIYIPIIIGEE